MEHAIKALTLTITSQMVRRGARFFNAMWATELLNERALKVTALVRMNVSRDTQLKKSSQIPKPEPPWRPLGHVSAPPKCTY